jgi:uncharacterized oxidoreductase
VVNAPATIVDNAQARSSARTDRIPAATEDGMNLRGKRILITGGGSGIGLELAQRLADANEVVIAGRDERKLDRARAGRPSLRTLRLDVTSEEQARDAIDRLSSELGGLDLLINNAGVMHGRALSASADPASSTDELEINLGGAVRMTRLALPLLHAAPEAGVLFMSSGVALTAVPGFAVYAATKAALHSLARSLRAELADTNIQVFEALPPVVDTGLLKRDLEVPKLTPAAVASAIIHGVARDRHEIPVGSVRGLVWLARVSPRFADRIVLRAMGGFEAAQIRG